MWIRKDVLGVNNDALVKEYQNIKDRIAKVESDKIKAETELDLESKKLEGIKDELQELNITDLEHIDQIVEGRRLEFEDALKSLKEQLDNVQ